MIDQSPRLVARRLALLDELGPAPSHWSFMKRRAWRRRRAAIMAISVSMNTELLMQCYPPELIVELAGRPNPWADQVRKRYLASRRK
jgi:hypothetical protein